VGGRQIGRIEALHIRLLRVADHAVGKVTKALERFGDVRYAEPDFTVRSFESIPNDYWWPSEWSPVKTRAPLAWDATTGSPGTVVAVLDSGVDFTQPGLQGTFVAGRDIVNNDADPACTTLASIR
jgi:subtilisin family serine protease